MVEVIRWQELVRRCGSRGLAQGQVRDGTWQRVLRDTYVDAGHDAAAPHVRAAALHLLLPRGVALSHRSALWVLGLDVLEGDQLDVVVERGRHLSARPGIRVHIADLPADQLVQVGELLATSAARAVVDLARCEPVLDAVALGDCALRAGVTLPHLLDEALHAAAGLRGVLAARAALPLLNGRSQSLNESRLRVRLHQGGLRGLDVQYDAYDRDGHIARGDLHLDGVWIEFDGREQRLSKSAFVAERRRQTSVAEAGFELRRFTSPDVYGRAPTSLTAEVVRAVALASTRDRSELVRGPDTLPPCRLRPLPTLAELRLARSA